MDTVFRINKGRVYQIDNGSRNFRHCPLALKITESSPHPSRDGGDLRTQRQVYTTVCVFRN